MENGADAGISDSYGQTPLHRVACSGLVKMAGLLIARGVDVNQRDALGNTPLHLAIEELHGETAKLLIQHNASLTTQNKESKVPFEISSGSKGHKTSSRKLAAGLLLTKFIRAQVSAPKGKLFCQN